jgi:hypothetical protein
LLLLGVIIFCLDFVFYFFYWETQCICYFISFANVD